MRTEQEIFWSGDFGDEYVERNRCVNWVASNVALFSSILKKTSRIDSVLELGSNIGLNLKALGSLLPHSKLAAVEINKKAIEVLESNLPGVSVNCGSIVDFDSKGDAWDLVFSKGVLIHINPEELENVYDVMYQCSSKYILIAEYYNPIPVEVNYRGFDGKLFKRDFAGEMLDRFPSLKLVDYGFCYHRDINFPQDDISWFLMEKWEK